MRLFTAINFEDKIKDYVWNTIHQLQQKGINGNFTLKENLHLTLVFIGQTNRVQDVKKIMKDIKANAFTITLNDFGTFQQKEGDILWLGMEASSDLYILQNTMQQALLSKGFTIDCRAYKPHLTLGRKVCLPEQYHLEPLSKPIKVEVANVSLMRSEWINGRLTYTELYKKDLSLF